MAGSSSSTPFTQHSWERPDPSKWSWELPESGLADFNSENESADEEDPGQELFSYLLSEHSAGKMTAKQVCIVSWWAAKAGVEAVKPIGTSPAHQRLWRLQADAG